MTISLTDTGKRFNRDWIFRHFSYDFQEGISYAVTGPNGSGKSTLLQLIGGAIMPSEGKIKYDVRSTKYEVRNTKLAVRNTKALPVDDAFRYIALAAPYLELIEEMTATELLEFHQQFKPLLSSLSIAEMIATVGLEKAAHKQVRYYSSGMKQRLKLAQAFFSAVPCLLLDEPCTNLDTEGIDLYHRLVKDYAADRLILVCSNDKQEYGFCEQLISITQYKK